MKIIDDSVYLKLCSQWGVSRIWDFRGGMGESHLVLQITGFPHRYMYLLFDLELGRAQFIDYVFLEDSSRFVHNKL